MNTWPEHERARHSEAMRRRWQDPEYRAHMSRACRAASSDNRREAQRRRFANEPIGQLSEYERELYDHMVHFKSLRRDEALRLLGRADLADAYLAMKGKT